LRTFPAGFIARRAREIAASPDARGDVDNWFAAEADLQARNLIGP
jgi:hypothetical protein